MSNFRFQDYVTSGAFTLSLAVAYTHLRSPRD